ncbi:mannonate dehydratase [Mucilaginibacter pedocola]|uniref:mannonate dehydratase n=1 Tax=Mucilaginibacter pedocola TaxID=1792845 RepID=A0A1S9PEM9_9SPHI|nr:mannonate dehydratase [Mucilaginibacter pedocola]OOQ59405.1 mannonate dehydratase [Mucilaginibacter pedocola]
MKDNRRDFIKKGASLAAALSFGGTAASAANSEAYKQGIKNAKRQSALVRDAGMQFCESYFFGMNPQKIALTKQMDVLGAVAGIHAAHAGANAKPWELDTIKANVKAWENVGLKLRVIEGPPSLGEKTKLGLAGRDEEIANFITFMKNLSKAGIDTICYNWMPVIGWYRTSNDKPGRGGALVTAFDYEDIKNAPLTKYGQVSKDLLWKNLEYFLKAVVPEAEKAGIKLAMHPDDPQVDSLRGISRIMTTVPNFDRMLKLYPSPNNGITMCQGNFSLMGVDIPDTIHHFGKEKIHFVHFRNVKGGKFKFEETFHDEGQIDMYKAMEAYYKIGFTGAIRPDHVPTMAGDSNENPGYSTIAVLYAIGYMRGLMEAVSRA